MIGSQAVIAYRMSKGFKISAKAATAASEVSELTRLATVAKNSGRFLGIAGTIATGFESYQQHNGFTTGDVTKMVILGLTTFTAYG